MYNQFPHKFKEFLKANDIDSSEYNYSIPRYVRLAPQVGIDEIRAELPPDVSLELVDWFQGFYSLPSDCKISGLKPFQDGLIHGMDLASAVAVHALDIQPQDHILDICCAPGTKLRLISDMLSVGLGSVTGVDCSKHRLFTTRSVLKKHSGDRIRLFLGDGCRFSVPPVSRMGTVILDQNSVRPTKRKDTERELEPFPLVKPFYATKLIRHDTQKSLRRYDKVIVDAECTHDGSVAHLEKYMKDSGFRTPNWDDFLTQLDDEKLVSLEVLQRGLIENGYRMVKNGGILVYSTCSFTVTQNEAILGWVLDQYQDATVEPVPGVEIMPIAPRPKKASLICEQFSSRGIEHSIRFTPAVSNTSGLFVARIRKGN
jgi:16S rRNA C967 or C1407 C5-methylase (RsmB/RsmF family)